MLDATACDGAGVLPQKRRITVTYSLPVGNIKQLQGCPACACLAAPLSSLREQSEPPFPRPRRRLSPSLRHLGSLKLAVVAEV